MLSGDSFELLLVQGLAAHYLGKHFFVEGLQATRLNEIQSFEL